MNYEDDRAETGFARGFVEGVTGRWVFSSRKNIYQE
jgi:hypothetical protein